MAQNLCSPTRIFGGSSIEQHLFLGLSVSSFDATVGFGGQVSELLIILAEDPCPSPSGSYKVYYDSNLERQETTAADFGFVGEGNNAIVGCPVYFRFADFEFSGIVQSWTKDENTNVYTVKISDPRQILEGTQLIIDEYSGSVGSTYNMANIYGFMESFGVDAPLLYQDSPSAYLPGDAGVDGAMFGTLSDGFGGSNNNVNGMQANRITQGINVLLNGNPIIANQWSSGRIIYKGPIGASSYGIMGADAGGFCQYFVDISELPTMPSEFRLQGPSITLMDFITLVCEEAGYEYYIELIPVQSDISPSGIAKFIKIRTVNRNVQPDLGAIGDFIADAQNGIISSSVGRELRNEVTSAFIIGGNKQTIYQIDQSLDPELDGQPTGNPEIDDIIVPFFGYKFDGSAIMPQKDSEGFWEFDINTIDLESQLLSLTFRDDSDDPVFEITINERELLFALAGYDQWLSYSTTEPKTDIALYAFPEDLIGLFDLTNIVALMTKPNADQKLFAQDIINSIKKVVLGNRANVGNNEQLQDLQTLYNFVLGLAREYYGRRFMVRVPYTAAKLETVSNRVVTSEEPSDGGWTEFSTVLSLPNPSIYLDFFRLDDSRIRPYVRFNEADKKCFTALDTNDYIILYSSTGENPTSDSNTVDLLRESGEGNYDVDAWVKVDVEPEYVYLNKESLSSPRALISLNAPVFDINDTSTHIQTRGLKSLAEKMLMAAGDKANFQANIDKLLMDIGGIELFFPLDFLPCMPDSAAIALKSNTLTYGPWYNPGPPGQTRVETDSELVPWNYNGIAVMNTAGQALADAGLTNLQVTEAGNIEVAGYPTIPLGAELGAYAGGFYGAGTNLIENRNVAAGNFSDTHHESGAYSADYSFFDYSGEWTGLYGPNVTDISVNVGPGGFTTTYGMRTYTPKYGRFAKYNADRLKLLAQQQKEINQLNSKRQLAFNNLGILNERSLIKQDLNSFNGQGKAHANNSPHSLLVGRQKVWGNTEGQTGEGETVTGEFSRFSVVTEEISDLGNEFGDGAVYFEKYIMSLDGLLRPVNSTELVATNLRGNHLIRSSLSSLPPVYKYQDIAAVTGDGEYPTGAAYSLGINGTYLNPTLNPDDTKYIKSGEGSAGHDIDMLGRNELPTYSHSIAIEEELSGTGYSNEYRYLALRGPLVLRSWGYDTQGKPVPNRTNDTDLSFESGGQDYFAENWLQKQHEWPVGPIDLRWDRARGVWVCPQPNKLIQVEMISYMAPNSVGTGLVVDNIPRYDKDGLRLDPDNTSTRPTVAVYDSVGLSAGSGNKLWAYWDDHHNKYYAISQTFSLAESGCGDTGDPTGLGFTPYSRFVLGKGLEFEDLGNGIASITNNFKVTYADTFGTGDIECVPNEYLDNLLIDGSQINNVQNITFGPGMLVSTGNNDDACGNIFVDTNFEIIGGDDSGNPVSAKPCIQLTFGDEFTFEKLSDCKVRIGLPASSGFTGNIPIITDSYCDSGGLHVQSGEIMVDDGLITGWRTIG